MGLFGKLRGAENGAGPDAQLMCPICGAAGQDDRHVSADVAAFEARPDVQGSSVRKCHACGGGFTISGSTAMPIPSDRWTELERSSYTMT